MSVRPWFRTGRDAAIAVLFAFSLVQAMTLESFAEAQEIESSPVPKSALEPRDTERDQAKLVGLLFPAFTGSSSTEVLTTFLFKEQVRLSLNSIDSGRALGFSQSYLIGAPLADESHAGAVRLARQNGFQGVVWGTVSEYHYKDAFDGSAVFPNFSWAGKYEDFRNIPGLSDRRLEIWMIDYNGNTVSAFPPSDFVPLPPYLIPQLIRKRLASGDICAHPLTGGSCVPLTEMGPTRAIVIDSSTGEVTYRAFETGSEYLVTFPVEIFADQPAVAYVAMFFNYSRGHWTNAIRFADEVEASEASTSQMVHDALLYRAAALFRSGHDGSIPLAKAQANFPFSPAVSQYSVMAALLRFKAEQITKGEFQDVVDTEGKRVGEGWLVANGLSNRE